MAYLHNMFCCQSLCLSCHSTFPSPSRLDVQWLACLCWSITYAGQKVSVSPPLLQGHLPARAVCAINIQPGLPFQPRHSGCQGTVGTHKGMECTGTRTDPPAGRMATNPLENRLIVLKLCISFPSTPKHHSFFSNMVQVVPPCSKHHHHLIWTITGKCAVLLGDNTGLDPSYTHYPLLAANPKCKQEIQAKKRFKTLVY